MSLTNGVGTTESPHGKKTKVNLYLTPYIKLTQITDLNIRAKNIQFLEENTEVALADVAQRIEFWPVNQRVVGSIPSQGTCLGCGLGPQ